MKIKISEAVSILPNLYLLAEKVKDDRLANSVANLVRELESIKTSYDLSEFECELIKYAFKKSFEKELKSENQFSKKRKTYKRREKKL